MTTCCTVVVQKQKMLQQFALSEQSCRNLKNDGFYVCLLPLLLGHDVYTN